MAKDDRKTKKDKDRGKEKAKGGAKGKAEKARGRAAAGALASVGAAPTGPEAAAERLEQLRAEVASLEQMLAGTPKRKTPPKVSPLAPPGFPSLPVVPGARFASAEAGVRYAGRRDVMLTLLDPGTVVAGVFTKSSTRAAPVLWCEALRDGPGEAGPQAILVNSGNANAFTGRGGMEACESLAAAVAAAAGVSREGVWLGSTGVIGEALPHERIAAKLDELVGKVSEHGGEDAARAIMTTDTFPKGSGAFVTLSDGAQVAVCGFAKGSGMIAPDMATMLGYVFTDAAVARPVLQAMLGRIADRTFNAITVDGDTSTSDTVLAAATGRAEMAVIERAEDPRAAELETALEGVLRDLAQQIVRDGEGATKFVSVTVTGAESEAAGRTIGLAIANSPLVKTAIAGEDPNWGRIVMAVGKSGEKADRDALSIRFGDITVAERGWVSGSYLEAEGAAYMKRPELEIFVDVGVGAAEATVWTCDLTHGYISINADYRS